MYYYVTFVHLRITRNTYISVPSFTGTVRDNILLGSNLNESRYKDVLYACSLDQDIKVILHIYLDFLDSF